jgi:AcrR family transcriptional regulator
MSQTEVMQPTETRNERRRRITDEKIAAAVLDIALEKGPHSVTFSAVSEESGVAKTTLYRRYQTRDELFDAVARHYSSTPDESDEAPTTPEGLAVTLQRGVTTLEEHMGLEAIGVLLASQDNFMQRVRHQLFTPQVNNAVDYFKRGVEAGVLRDDIDYALVVEMIYGGMILRSAGEGKLDHSWANAVVDFIWPCISRDEAQTSTH